MFTNRTGLFISEWTFGAPVNLDLNGDTVVDIADALRFLQYFHTSLSGLTALEAFSRGDMNGDFLSNHTDFRIFKVAYNGQVGEGAFETAAAAPEPSCVLLAVIASAVGLMSRHRRRRPVP